MTGEEIKDEQNGIDEQEVQGQVDSNDIETIDIEEQLAEEKDRNLRLFAEFENFRKRTARERLELFSTANEDLIKVLLPVLDDFDRAITQMETLGASEHLTGFNLISQKLRDNLSSKGLVLMNIEIGDTFDADIAEAVTQIPA